MKKNKSKKSRQKSHTGEIRKLPNQVIDGVEYTVSEIDITLPQPTHEPTIGNPFFKTSENN